MKLSFQQKILGIVLLAVLTTSIGGLMASWNHTQQEIKHALVDKSRALLSRIDAVRGFVADQGILEATVEKIQKDSPDGNLSDDQKRVVMNSVPIYAAMKVGAHASKEDNYIYRVFSDEPRRKENLATRDELVIFNKFLKDPQLKEFVVENSDYVAVYRPVYLSKDQGCLVCHGDPKNSPWNNGKDILGHRMENWSDGKLHGVMAVISDLKTVQEARRAESGLQGVLTLLGLAGAGGLMALAIAYLLLKTPISLLKHVTLSLNQNGQQITTAASGLEESSVSLNQTATDAAASIQLTSASITQISAMVERNTEHASRGHELSTTTVQAADKGQVAVQQMLSAIEDLNQTNAKVLGELEESNKELGTIVQVIGEIGDKTKVINDIVFQTKLLSFNASVEAARAGEQGKGFAVVAEEIGNLASMSGEAAKQITVLLSTSREKVSQVVNETRQKMDTLVQSTRIKVGATSESARKVGDELEGIVAKVQQLGNNVNDIANASQEQGIGIREVNKAVGEFDKISHSNAIVAQKTAQASGELTQQAEEMHKLVSQLDHMLSGVEDKSVQVISLNRRDSASDSKSLRKAA